MPTPVPLQCRRRLRRPRMALALILTTISPEVGGVLVRGEKGTAKSTIVRGARRGAAADRRHRRRPVLQRPARPGTALPRRAVRGRRRHRDPAGPPGRAARRRHRGPGARLAAPRARAVRGQGGVRARPARPGAPRHPVRRRGQPAARPPRRPAARRRRDGPLDRRARRRLGRARRPVRAGRHHEPRGGRAPAAAARPVRAHRRGRRTPRPGRRGSRWSAAGWPTTPTPTAFAAAYADAERALTERIQAAQALVGRRRRSPTRRCSRSPRCARPSRSTACAPTSSPPAPPSPTRPGTAATSVTREDIRAAARLALPHRRRRNPFDAPGLDEDLLDQVLGDDEPEPDPDPEPDPEPDRSGRRRPDGGPDGPSDASRRPTRPSAPTASCRRRSRRRARSARSAPPATQHHDRRPPARRTGRGCSPSAGPARGRPGARSRAITETGRRIGARPAGSGPVHLTETIRAAAPHQVARGRTGGRLRFLPEDLRVATARARSPTSCCSASTPPARWPPASGWSRSRPRSCRCCSTPTSAATRSAW